MKENERKRKGKKERKEEGKERTGKKRKERHKEKGMGEEGKERASFRTTPKMEKGSGRKLMQAAKQTQKTTTKYNCRIRLANPLKK